MDARALYQWYTCIHQEAERQAHSLLPASHHQATLVREATVTPATAVPPPTGLNKATSHVLPAKFGSDPSEVVAVTVGDGCGEGDRTLKFILIHMAGVIRVGVALIPGEFS